MITGKVILVPTQDSSAESVAFDVDDRSVVCYLFPDEGETLTDDDAFRLCRVLEANPLRVLPVVDNGSNVLMGANNTQVEVLIRGTYLWEKILATTEAVGIARTYGIEEGS